MIGSKSRNWGIAGLLGLAAFALAAAPAGAVEPPPDHAASMYTLNSVVAIDLTMPQASREALEAEPPTDEYQPGTFSLATTDGTPDGIGEFSAPINVGIRLKGGEGSFRPLADEKAAFKIKFNFVKGQKFLGLKKMTLNNMVQDPSMVHETLAYEAFRSVGAVAPRTGYAYLRVDGIDYGVYLNLELSTTSPCRAGSVRPAISMRQTRPEPTSCREGRTNSRSMKGMTKISPTWKP